MNSALTPSDLQLFTTGLRKLWKALEVIKPGVERLIRFLTAVPVDKPSVKKVVERLYKHATETEKTITSGDTFAKQQHDHAMAMAAARDVCAVLTAVNDGYFQLMQVSNQINELDIKLRDASIPKSTGLHEHFPEELEAWDSTRQTWVATTEYLWGAEADAAE